MILAPTLSERYPNPQGLESFRHARLERAQVPLDQFGPSPEVDSARQQFPQAQTLGDIQSQHLRQDIQADKIRKSLGVVTSLAATSLIPTALLSGLSAATLGLGALTVAGMGAAYYLDKREGDRRQLLHCLEKGASDYLQSKLTPGPDAQTRLDQRFPEDFHGIRGLTLIENEATQSVQEVTLQLNDQLRLRAHPGKVDFQFGQEQLTLPGSLSLPIWERDGTLAYECKDPAALQSAHNLLEQQGIQVGKLDKGHFFFRPQGPMRPSTKREDYQQAMDDWYFQVTTPP